MDIRQLRFFVAVADSGSFSEAAARMRIAQPSLSVRIAQLEQELGCKLLQRGARGVRPTEAGLRLRSLASELVERFDEVRDEIARDFGEATPTVTLGLPPVLALSLAVPLIRAAPGLVPRVELKIVEGMSGTIAPQLNERALDLAVLHNVESGDFPFVLPLLEESLHVVGLRSSLSSRGTLSVRDMAELPLVLPTIRNNLRLTLERAAREVNIRLKIVAEIDSLPRLLELVRGGLGYTVLPPAAIERRKVLGSAPLNFGEVSWRSSIVIGRRPLGSEAIAQVCRLIGAITGDLIRAGNWRGGRAADLTAWPAQFAPLRGQPREGGGPQD